MFYCSLTQNIIWDKVSNVKQKRLQTIDSKNIAANDANAHKIYIIKNNNTESNYNTYIQ